MLLSCDIIFIESQDYVKPGPGNIINTKSAQPEEMHFHYTSPNLLQHTSDIVILRNANLVPIPTAVV